MCGAVMHQVNGEGPFKCSFTGSHADILRMRAAAATRKADAARGDPRLKEGGKKGAARRWGKNGKKKNGGKNGK